MNKKLIYIQFLVESASDSQKLFNRKHRICHTPLTYILISYRTGIHQIIPMNSNWELDTHAESITYIYMCGVCINKTDWNIRDNESSRQWVIYIARRDDVRLDLDSINIAASKHHNGLWRKTNDTWIADHFSLWARSLARVEQWC